MYNLPQTYLREYMKKREGRDLLIMSHPKTNELEVLTFPSGTLARHKRWAILETVLASSEIENEGVPEHIANQLRDEII